MAQEIVFYHSSMAGAPSGTLNAVGALLAVLDACLVNGFNLISVSTLTRSGSTATATTSASHNFSVGDWIEVANANESAYNGRVKVLSKPAANQFTYAVSGTPSTPATGTISAKHPPAGWSKSNLGTNIAGYQSGAGSLGLWMQVEDNNPFSDSHTGARTRIAQGLTALDTASVLGSQINTQKLTGGWLLVADQKTCYLFTGNIAAGTQLTSFCFGEIASFYSADQFSFFQNQSRSQPSLSMFNEDGSYLGESNYGPAQWPWYQSANGALTRPETTLLRAVSQLGGPAGASPLAMWSYQRYALSGDVWGLRPQQILVPNLADNAVPVVPLFCIEYVSANWTVRGRHRGIYWPLGRMPNSGFVNSFQRLDNAMIDGVLQSLLLVRNGYTGGGGQQLAFQVDGAWS